MKIHALAAWSLAPITSAANPPAEEPRFSLEDAFESLGNQEVGTTRYPGTWSIKGARYAVPLHDPVVGPDDTIYQVDSNAVLALDPRTGEEKFRIPGEDVGVPALLGDRLVCCERQAVFAFDPSRRVRAWTVPVESGWFNQPLVSSQGVVYTGGGGGLLALDGSNGSRLWRAELPGCVSPLGLGQLGTVVVRNGAYLAESEKKLYGVGPDGDERWSRRYDSAAMTEGGPVFCVKERFLKLLGFSHTLRALDPDTGAVLWKQAVKSEVSMWPTPSGDVVVGEGRDLRLLDGRTGKIRWSAQFKTEPSWNGPPGDIKMLGSDLVVLHPDGSLSALDPRTGKPAWEEPSRGEAYSAPSLAPGGVLVMKARDGRVLGMIPAELAARGRPRSRPGVEESPSAVRIGGVQVRKRSVSDAKA